MKKYIILLFFMLSYTLLAHFPSESAEKEIPPLPRYTVHYVSKGENLYALAAYYLGAPRRWKEIYEMNKDVIENFNSLEIGIKLMIKVSDNWSPPSDTIEEFWEKINLSSVRDDVEVNKNDKPPVRRTPKKTIKPAVTCVDSDSGQIIHEAGTTCLDGKCQTDRCVYSNSRLMEYYCKNNDIEEMVYDCENGCLEGACSKEKRIEEGEDIKEQAKEEGKEQSVAETGKEEPGKEQSVAEAGKEEPGKEQSVAETGKEEPGLEEVAEITIKEKIIQLSDVKSFDVDTIMQLVFLSGFPRLILAVLILVVAILLLFMISVWKVFLKAGQPGWGSIIPIYNLYLMLKIGGKPGWWLIFFLIPVVSLIFYLILMVAIAKNFGKGLLFGLGMSFLNFIFFPILAFGKATYKKS